jgi:hypothetical protein
MKTAFALVLAVALAPCMPSSAAQGAGREPSAPQGGGREVSPPVPQPKPKPRSPAGKTGGSRSTRKSTSSSAPKTPATAELSVRSSPPGCDVAIDGNPVGKTDSGGLLTVASIKPGRHTVSIRKDRYREERREVTLVAGGDRAVDVTLAPVPGTITVNVNLPGAEIRIGEGVVRSDKVESLEVAPGRYDVSVTKLGYKPYHGTANLEPGQSVRIDAAIEPLTLKGLVELAEDEFVRERYANVITLCDMVLADKPNRPRANLLLGASLFRSGRSADSLSPLLKAIEGGERVAVPVRQRRDSVGPGETEGLLVVGRDVVAFLAPTDPGLEFATPLRGVMHFERSRGAKAPVLMTVDLSDESRLPGAGLCLAPCGSSTTQMPGRKGRGKKDAGEVRPSRPRSVRKKDRGDDRDGRRASIEEIEYASAPSSEAALDLAAQLYARLRR